MRSIIFSVWKKKADVKIVFPACEFTMAGKCDGSLRNSDMLRILVQSVFCDTPGISHCFSFVIPPVSIAS